MVTTRQSLGAPVVDRATPEPPAAPEGTTRVTMLAAISGTRNGQEWPRPGEDIDLPAAEAADLVRMYLAKPAPEPVERAVIDDTPPERAVVSRAQSARPARGGRSKGE